MTPESGISVDPSSLTFTTANWDQEKQITVSADDNVLAEGAQRKKITHAVSSTDPYYDGTRVKHEFVTVHDNESPSVLNFAKRSKAARPPFYVFSGAFMTRENNSVDQWPPAYNEQANYPKDRNILLSVGVENPHPSATIEVVMRLVDNKLKQNADYTPAFAGSDDLEGFVDTTITFTPGDTLIEFEIQVTNDDMQEGLEIAQFALGCASATAGDIQIGTHNIASVGISDDDSDTDTEANIIISEIYRGAEPGDVAIELFNANYRDLALSAYHLEIEKSSGGTITINYLRAYNDGSIRPGDTWVICGTNAPEHVQKTANYVDARLNEVTGNDVIKLMQGTTVKDIVGVSGSHPAEGEGWTVAGVADATTRTMIRKFDVKAGVSDFTPELTSTSASSEWVIEAQGYYRNVGIHAYQTGSYEKVENTDPDDPCGGTTSVDELFGSVEAYEAFVYPNPASDVLHVAHEACQAIYLYALEGSMLDQVANQSYMNIEYLPSGVYLLRVQTKEGVSCHRFVKE